MNGLSLAETADTALAFWMLHEVLDQAAFLAEVPACLKPGGRLLIVEPCVQVGSAAFERSVEMACLADLLSVVRPAVAMSRAVLCSR